MRTDVKQGSRFRIGLVDHWEFVKVECAMYGSAATLHEVQIRSPKPVPKPNAHE